MKKLVKYSIVFLLLFTTKFFAQQILQIIDRETAFTMIKKGDSIIFGLVPKLGNGYNTYNTKTQKSQQKPVFFYNNWKPFRYNHI